jgi:hypothetical protein
MVSVEHYVKADARRAPHHGRSFPRRRRRESEIGARRAS